MANNIDELLWNYVDGTCNAEDRKMIEGFLQNDDEWKKKYQELQEVNRFIQESIELEEPSMRFVKNVMEEIAETRIAPATKTYINKKIIYSIAVFFIIVIAGLVVYGFSQIKWDEPGNNASLFITYKLDIGRYFDQRLLNIFLMLNMVLGLILFDRIFGKTKSKRHA